jgi:RHS repeat-associated protein
MTRTQRSFLLVIVLALTARVTSAQVATGTPPFGSFGGGPDVINLANLNAHLDIPIFHRPGRGTNFTYDLDYDSSVWYPVTVSGQLSWQPASGTWGWQGLAPGGTFFITYMMTYTSSTYYNGGPVPYQEWSFTNFVYHDSFGISHAYNYAPVYFQSPGGSNCPPNGPQPSTPQAQVASDGSGYTLYASPNSGFATAYIIASNGATINPPVGPAPPGSQGSSSVTDRNGNQITSNNGVYTDTLGTTALTVAGTAPSNTTFTYTAPSGASAKYTLKYTTYTVQTNFGCSGPGISEYGPTSTSLASEIDLPDIAVNPNDKYTFAYETTPGDAHNPHYVTGRLVSVTLPTGGTISYTYTGGSSGHITCADGSAAGIQRTTPDTLSGSYWNLVRSGTAPATTTTITDPSTAANVTAVQFQGIYETQRDSYQGAASPSNLLQTIKTCYNNHITNCTTTAVTLPISQRNIFTVLSSGMQSEHDDFWNTHGAPTETDDYDYGTAPHGSLLKKVLATYATLGNITAFRQSVTTQNGSGTNVSKINYNYDEGTRTATSGTPQHINVSAPWGNQTSVNIYTGPTTYLTKSTTYYDTGTPNAATDVNGGVTTYSYASGAASCYNSFPTSITEAVTTLSTSMTWNCTGGVQLTAIDENNQTTTTAYNDAYFWRPSSVTDPTGAITGFCYGLQTSGTCAVNSIQSESILNFNSNNSTVDVLTTFDGLGRTHVLQTRQGPSSTNFDSVETDYDALGRVSRVTLPYSGTAGQTNSSVAATTTSYDALSRPLTVLDGGNGSTVYYYGQPGSQNNDVLVTRNPAPTGEHTKSRQFEYDGLGRLASVCEITAGATPWTGGNCAQNSAQTGYWTKYAYDPMGNLLTSTQNAQMSGSTQSRSYVYDFMSRMTSETVPEIGAGGNGTVIYVYDSDSTCGTYNGGLVKRVDAAGDVICSTYDALHRELVRSYPSGTYASVTPQKHFVYDGATINTSPSQTPMSYAKARLAEAYTCFSPCSAKLTDIGLSYSVRGQTSDTYESTPNSGGFYYHTSLSYWANRGSYQLTGNIGLPTTITYGPDGEGRTSTVSASSGQNPIVSSTSYNTASLPTAINLGSGSGDTDAYQYDPNTNRMTQYKFTVNGTSLTGALGWNANGTLQTQNITDGFNSADTQNCSYGYDDITRLANANCGSAAGQTFSFDPFGNINKSGSPYTFNAFYSTSNNRITCIGGSGQNCTGGVIPTYDNNGNVTNDSFHNYTWDSDGHAVSVDAGLSDAVSVTYDALGRMVEQQRGSAYTQIAYSPSGQKLTLMNGQTLQKAMVPLIRGAQAAYNSSGLLYYAHPDLLASIRLATTPTTRVMYFDTAYAPFSETYASATAVGVNLDPAYTGQMNDTAHRQDSAGGLYDFPLREYSTQGRWPSPDPMGRAATCPKDPQTQNRYSYVRNNPMNYTDPTGGFIVYAPPGDGGGCDPLDPFCQDLCLLYPWLCFSGGGGGGGVLPAGGGGSTPTQPFPWPSLPPGFFLSLESGGGDGAPPAPPGGVCDCFKGFGWSRGWTGCSYDCMCAGVPAVAYKKCSIFSPYADESCPFYTEWNIGPNGVGGPGSLIYPPNFCGPPLLPPRR